ncbi:uncharacterized protein METZ01_LOCUS24555, partial [marine metagenome]
VAYLLTDGNSQMINPRKILQAQHFGKETLFAAY